MWTPHTIELIYSSPRFKFASFSPENFISDGKRLKSGLPIRCNFYTHVRDFKFANFSPEKIFSDRKLLKSGLPIRYSVYTQVRDLNLPTFHRKILFQTENVSNLESPYHSVYTTTEVRDLNLPTFHPTKTFKSGLPIRYNFLYSCPGFKFAYFSPEKIFSNGKLLKSGFLIRYSVYSPGKIFSNLQTTFHLKKTGIPIRYSVYTHVRDLNLPTFHLKILFQTENFSNLDSPYDIGIYTHVHVT